MGCFRKAIQTAYSSIRKTLQHETLTKGSVVSHNEVTAGSTSKPLPATPMESNPLLALEQDIIDALKHRLCRDQELEVEKVRITADLEAVEKARGELRAIMNRMEHDLEKAKINHGLTSKKAAKLEARLLPFRKKQERLNEMPGELKEEREALNDEQNKQRTRVCTIMESLLIDAGAMEEFEPSPLAVRAETTAMLGEIGTDTDEIQIDEVDNSESDIGSKSHNHSSSDAETVVQHPPSASDQQQQDLNRTYVIMRGFLRQAQAELEDRHEIFDQERADFRKGQEGKGQPDSVTALDIDHLERTRELTQAVAETEVNLHRAKQAAFLAGVDLGESDLESGFVDRADGGYRMSQENAEHEEFEIARFQKWLNDVKEPEDEEAPAEGVEIDHWDAQSVELSDSASMVAEGPARRRIDRWNRALAETPG